MSEVTTAKEAHERAYEEKPPVLKKLKEDQDVEAYEEQPPVLKKLKEDQDVEVWHDHEQKPSTSKMTMHEQMLFRMKVTQGCCSCSQIRYTSAYLYQQYKLFGTTSASR